MGEGKRRREEREARTVHFEALQPEDRLGDAPIEAEYHEKMVEVAGVLDEIFNGQRGGPGRKTGFVLLTFPFNGHEGRCNFLSNGADRKDVVVLMKEMISRFSGAPDQSGTA